MHDFDEVRERNRLNSDRKFKLLGRTFTFREYLDPLTLAPVRVIGLSDEEWLKVADDVMVEALLEPGHADDWAAVRAEKEKPLSIFEIGQIMEHIQEVTSGRPTQPSSVSSTTPSRRGTTSTEKSPSPAGA